MLPGPRPLQAVVWLAQRQDGVHHVGVLRSGGGGGRVALHLQHSFTGLLATRQLCHLDQAGGTRWHRPTHLPMVLGH